MDMMDGEWNLTGGEPPVKEREMTPKGGELLTAKFGNERVIDSGYDAIIVDAQNPTAFGPVIKRAKAAGVDAGRVRQHSRHRGRH